ncbi:hypothetical protein H1R20_g14884, partial [Candolleomyces eurysporus]
MARHRRPDLHRSDTSATIARDQGSREGSPSDRYKRLRRTDIFLLFTTLFSIAWPWAFFGTVAARGGVALPRSLADYVVDNPQRVSTFVTFVGTVHRILCAILFTFVIERFAQEWVRGREGIQDPISVFDVSVLLAFRHKSFVWELSEYKDWKVKGRWAWVVLLVLFTTMFAMIPTGIVALITPGPYVNVGWHMGGMEIDFSTSNDLGCLETLAVGRPLDCQLRPSEDMKQDYVLSCLYKAGPDMLSSVIDRVTTLRFNKSGIVSMSMMSGGSPLRFLGPSRGVLPMGPGAPGGYNRPNHLVNASTVNFTEARIRSFNYTLQQQGLYSNTSCKYSESSPITFAKAQPEDRTIIIDGTGACDALNLTDVFGQSNISIPLSSGTLAPWGCEPSRSEASDLSPVVYLRQRLDRNNGTYDLNITCTSPIRVGLVNATFESSSTLFRTDSAIRPSTDTTEMERVLLSIITWASLESILAVQNQGSNMLLDIVLEAGVMGSGLAVMERNDQYLRLYEAMLDSIFEYNKFPHTACVRFLGKDPTSW